MATAQTRTCPQCERRFSAKEAKHLPFCSERCRMIDLGAWLDERRGLPVVDSEEDPERESLDEER